MGSEMCIRDRIYKETGLIEAMPVLTGVVLLNIAIYQKEKVTAYAA